MNAPASAGVELRGAKAGGKRERERDGSEKTCHLIVPFVSRREIRRGLESYTSPAGRNTGWERIIACTSMPRPRARYGSTESHAALVAGRALRRGDCGGAHLLFAAGHRAQRDHRQTAGFHRSADLRGRAPHRLPARPFRVRPRKHFAPAGLERPALVSVLQLRAVEPALRQAERAARVRAADRRRGARRLRAGRAPRLGRLLAALGAAQGRCVGDPEGAALRPRHEHAGAAQGRRARGREEGDRDRALRDPDRRLHVDGAHGLGHRPAPPPSHAERRRRAVRSGDGDRRDGRPREGSRPDVLREGRLRHVRARHAARDGGFRRRGRRAMRLPRSSIAVSAAASPGSATGRPAPSASSPTPSARRSA